MPRSLLRNAAGAARCIASTSSERVNSCTGNIRVIGYGRETINVSGSSHSDPLFHRYFRNLSSRRDYYNILQKNAKIHHRKISLQRKNNVSLCRFFSAVSSNYDDKDQDDEGEEEEEDDGLEYLTDLSPGVKSKIRAMKARHDEIIAQMQDFDNINGGGSHNPGGGGDATSLGKELSSLSAVSYLCERAAEIHAERVSLLELLAETKSAGGEEASEMEEEIRQELVDLDEQSTALSHKFLHSLVPLINPDDVQDLTASDAVIDIRAGTGGDEACLFAAELMAGYEATAKAGGGDDSGFGAKSWEVEVLSVSRTDLGGIKEASLVVSSSKGGGGGYNSFDSHQQEDIPQNDEELTNHLLSQLGPYGFFRFESGVHRVQRVPVNDVKMQTSAVSVAIMPSLPDHALPTALPPNELKIDTMRASGAGGQHVNTTESAVRVTHIPTGIMACIQDERSQHKNRAKALKLVAARVYSHRKEQETKDRSAIRSSLMGGGDRSERIRTYNFPQDRITDHRCKVSVSGVSSWMSGGGMVRNFAPYLYMMEREERVEKLEEEEIDNAKKESSSGEKRKRSRAKSGH